MSSVLLTFILLDMHMTNKGTLMTLISGIEFCNKFSLEQIYIHLIQHVHQTTLQFIILITKVLENMWQVVWEHFKTQAFTYCKIKCQTLIFFFAMDFTSLWPRQLVSPLGT